MKANTIVRAKRENPFVQIDKHCLQDPKLSWKAKGILAYMLSMPSDWQFYVSELQNHAKDGRDSTASAIKELLENGYLTRDKVRDESGQFAGYQYTLYEIPITACPNTENPFTDNPNTENHELLIINNTNNNSTNIIKESSENESQDSTIYKTPKEKKKKVSPKKKSQLTYVYPPEFSESLISVCTEFFEYRKEIKKGYKSQKGINGKIAQFQRQLKEYGEQAVIESIQTAIANQYQGTFIDKKYQNNGKQTYNKRTETVDEWANRIVQQTYENIDISEFED